MRSADLTTIIRSIIILIVAYLVIIKFNLYFNIFLLIIAIVLDGVDGFLAIKEIDNSFSFLSYIKAQVLNNKKEKEKIKKLKLLTKEKAKYGARLDVAGDRIIEYTIFSLFVYLHFIPLLFLLISFFIHSFADALMGSKGTSSKMKTKLASIFYTSNWSRALANLLKIASFSMLIFSYQTGLFYQFTFALTTLLLIFIILRGSIEIFESIK